MILPIYIYGQPVLRKVAKPITPDYPNLKELIENMKETMYASDGIGIAAPQVGLDIRLIYIDVDVIAQSRPELKDIRMVLINPVLEVDETSKTSTTEEGCLSLPGIHENVTRHDRIRLKWLDENWQAHDEVIEGYLARVVQHEYDHLEGHMFIDHVSAIRKQLNRGKLNNMVEGKVDCDYRVKTVRPQRRR
ncbi:MAG: peptide deformylase [Muribaculaceae bacterium]|nr:peptide deformylase [Muribaculaceae bacterium]